MDLYIEAKMRHQERLSEANISRLLKSARECSESMQAGLRSHFLAWLGGQMVASGTRLQMQCK